MLCHRVGSGPVVRLLHLQIAAIFLAGMVVGVVGTHYYWLATVKERQTLTIDEMAMVMDCVVRHIDDYKEYH